MLVLRLLVFALGGACVALVIALLGHNGPDIIAYSSGGQIGYVVGLLAPGVVIGGLAGYLSRPQKSRGGNG